MIIIILKIIHPETAFSLLRHPIVTSYSASGLRVYPQPLQSPNPKVGNSFGTSLNALKSFGALHRLAVWMLDSANVWSLGMGVPTVSGDSSIESPETRHPEPSAVASNTVNWPTPTPPIPLGCWGRG